MDVADCKIGQLRKEGNGKQNSYDVRDLIGVHSTMHLMHPNYGHVTTMNCIVLLVLMIRASVCGVHPRGNVPLSLEMLMLVSLHIV